MNRICECGHRENDHADIGLRRCARMGCPCDQYLEDDDAIEWKEGKGRSGLGDVAITVALITVCLIALAKCLSMGPEREGLGKPGRVLSPSDSAIIDSVKPPVVPVVPKCKREWNSAVGDSVWNCPDPKPPGIPPAKKAIEAEGIWRVG